MAVMIVFAVLMITVAAIAAFGGPEEAGWARRMYRRLRRHGRARSAARRAAGRRAPVRAASAAGTEDAPPEPPGISPLLPLRPADAEAVLVAHLLSGRLSRRAYQRYMAELAAEEEAREAWGPERPAA